jgi:hypothetical protein
LTIDRGWREVATTALAFIKRFAAPSRPAAGSFRRDGGEKHPAVISSQ